MKKIYLVLALLGGLSACTLKYEVLKGTSLTNPPPGPIKIYIREFPVESKANVVDPRVANSAAASQGQQAVTNSLASEGSKLVQISRPSRIEDLSGAVLRELRKDKVRIFSQTDRVKTLDEDSVRQVDNPFELVSEGTEADLEISGSALITSQRVRKVFSQLTQGVQVEVEVKDLKTGNSSKKSPINAGVIMTFNSRELEEALAIAVVTSLTQKLLF
jgi:hypothetical protein